MWNNLKIRILFSLLFLLHFLLFSLFSIDLFLPLSPHHHLHFSSHAPPFAHPLNAWLPLRSHPLSSSEGIFYTFYLSVPVSVTDSVFVSLSIYLYSISHLLTSPVFYINFRSETTFKRYCQQ